jgi:regulator of sirC expression with transglutaminase-like and TPR domain
MKDEEEARTYGKPLPVFASHPKTAERLEDVQAAAASSGVADGERGRDEYRAAMRPFVAGWLEDELSRRMYDTSIQVFEELRQQAEPELQANYVFFLGEAFRRRGKPGDSARAEALYEEAIALPDPPAAAFREHGMALRAQGLRAESAAALSEYLTRSPEAEDAAFVRQYLAEMEATP